MGRAGQFETDTNGVLDHVRSALCEGRVKVAVGADGKDDRDGVFENPRTHAHSTRHLFRALSPAGGVGPGREVVVERLREQIRQIENRGPVWALPADSDAVLGDTRSAAGSPSGLPVEDGGAHPRNAHPAAPSSSPLSNADAAPFAQVIRRKSCDDVWTLGDQACERLVGRQGFDIAAVHEIKPQLGEPDASASLNWAASWSAARGFLTALVARRLRSLARRTMAPPPVLWCCPKVFAQELGGPYAAGLAAYGIHPESLIFVEPARAQDVLWAMEEGLKSHAVACVVGILDDIAMTPARRLALAAQKHRVPCLALTHPRAPPMPATATRWRIAPASSSTHSVRPGLPGNLNLTLGLERRRADPLAGPVTAVTVEWCHETLSFGLVGDVRDRSFARSITSPQPRPLGQRRSG